MKKNSFFALLGILSMTILISACSKDEAEATFYTGGNSSSNYLSADEQEHLFVVEELTKFQADIYSLMLTKNQSEIFSELLTSEKSSLDMIAIRIDRHGLTNPILNLEAGVFSRPELQAAYDSFMRSDAFGYHQMLNFAKQMEEDFLAEIQHSAAELEGNSDIARLYNDIAKNANRHVNQLVEELERFNNQSKPVSPQFEF